MDAMLLRWFMRRVYDIMVQAVRRRRRNCSSMIDVKHELMLGR